jgi:hypothetical protein
MSVTHPEFFIALQTGQSTLALGEPGITKTRTVEAFAKAMKREFESVIPSQRDPADICGYPHISDYQRRDGTSQKVADFCKARWRVRLEEAPNGGVVLLDEALDCSPSHQAAIQQVLNDGIENCWVAGCGNPVDVSTNGYELAPAVVNRLCVLDYAPPVDEWKLNLMSDFQVSSSHFPVLPENWRTSIPEARGLVLGFLEAKPDLAQRLPNTQEERGKPWPSLRSWTNAATLLAAALSYEQIQPDRKSTVAQSLVAGCVGHAVATQFMRWRHDLDLPKLSDVLEEPETVDWNTRGDRVWAILAAVVSHTLGKKDDAETWCKAANVCTVAGAHKLAIAASAFLQINKAEYRPHGCKPDEATRKRFIEIIRNMTAA